MHLSRHIRMIITAFAVILSMTAAPLYYLPAAYAQEEPEAERYIVKVKDDLSARQERQIDQACDQDGVLTEIAYADGLYTAESAEEVYDVIDEAAIDYIEPDGRVYLMDEPNDAFYGIQSNLDLMHIPDVWEQYGTEGQDMDPVTDMDGNGIGDDDEIVIGVIDSGLSSVHEDIDYSRVIPGVAIIDDEMSDDTEDEIGHGTFVTAIIAAVKNNRTGIAGILQKVKVMPLCVFKQSEQSYDSDVVRAIYYAIGQKKLYEQYEGAVGANICVLNMSFGSEEANTSLQTACEDAAAAGIITVCAGGNSGSGAAIYPAMYAMGVGSVNRSGVRSSFSQYLSIENGEGFENKIWVMAAGEGIKSAGIGGPSVYKSPKGADTGQGTSYACPHVAALAAVCKSLQNDMTQQQFMLLMKNTALYKKSASGDYNGQDILYGWGIADFKSTVDTLYDCVHNGHHWDEGVVVREPSRTRAGESLYTCRICGREETFVIPQLAPAKVTGVTTTGSYGRKGFKISFNKAATATDYQIAYRMKGASSWKSVKTGGRTSVFIGGLKPGKQYEFKVRALRSKDSAKGKYSSVKRRLMSRTVPKLKAGSHKITVTWKKAAGAGYYQIQYSLYKNMKNAKTITVSSGRRSRIIRGLKKDKRYYVRIRPMKKDGSSYAGIYSQRKTRTSK